MLKPREQDVSLVDSRVGLLKGPLNAPHTLMVTGKVSFNAI